MEILEILFQYEKGDIKNARKRKERIPFRNVKEKKKKGRTLCNPHSIRKRQRR